MTPSHHSHTEKRAGLPALSCFWEQCSDQDHGAFPTATLLGSGAEISDRKARDVVPELVNKNWSREIEK
jgi:hypothetical protein